MPRIALAQINPTVGDLNGNAKKIVEYIEAARAKAADLVVFPELSLCGYPPEDLLYKENFVRDNLRALRSIEPRVLNLTAMIGFVDQDKKGQMYNAAAVIYGGKRFAVCHKEQLPNYGVFDEKRYFTPGRNEFVFALGQTTFGLNICEDIWADDGLYLRQAKKGARLLINISASPYHEGKLEIRKKLLKARARETGAYICYANIVGGQDELVFDGASLIVDPKGRWMAQGKEFEEDLIVTDIEASGQKKSAKTIFLPWKKNETNKPPLESPLHQSLGPTESVYKALVLGTRDYIRKNAFQKAVVGLSGGIDSALVAALAIDAIGEDNIIGVTMPSRFSSVGTRADAKTLAQNFNLKLYAIPIDGIFDSYLELLKEPFGERPFDLAEENLQARIRGNLLMALSNKFGWLVLTTGNKSEIAVGYCTLYGDMSGGFCVIKDVPKTKVYELCRFKNASAGREIIPASVFDRAPTAELRHRQTDQDTLPPYPLLDGILKGYVEQHHSFAHLVKEFKDAATVKKVIQMVDRSEYKRRQAAPGVKISPRAFGKDWRLPITNKYKEF